MFASRIGHGRAAKVQTERGYGPDGVGGMNTSEDNQAPARTWVQLSNSASRAVRSGDFEKAELLLLDAYECCKRTYGPNDGTVGLVLLDLADLCDKQRKFALGAEYRAEIRRIIDDIEEKGT